MGGDVHSISRIGCYSFAQFVEFHSEACRQQRQCQERTSTIEVQIDVSWIVLAAASTANKNKAMDSAWLARMQESPPVM